MVGLIVDGAKGPVAILRDIGKHWRVTYSFGRTEAGALTLARLKLRRNGRMASWETYAGITVALIRQQLQIAYVQRYLQACNRRATAPAKPGATKKGPGRSSQFYRKLLERYQRLVDAEDKHPAKTLADQPR